MRRRRLLAAVGAGLSLAGCQSRGDGPTTTATPVPTDTPDGTPGGGRRYEECPREVVPYDQFPADLRAEIDAALEGGYTADRVYLREAMDVEASYVAVDDEYYDPAVAVGGGRETLELDLVDPKALPDPRPVSVTHERDGERTVAIELRADDGTRLLDGARELYPGAEVEFGTVRRVGTHDLRVTVRRDGDVEDEATASVTVDESWFSVLVVVEDEVTVTGAVADLGICRYE